MKKNILLLTITICAVSLMWSCDKKTDLTANYTTTPDQGYVAYVKVVDAAPSFRQVFNGSDSFNVYFNGPKVNGTILSFNSIFPSTTNLYAAVPAGPQAIRITVTGKTLQDSTLATINKTLTAGSYYSYIITDSALTSNESKQIWLTDNFAATDTSHFSARFVHAALNDTLGKNIDVFSTLNNANILSNVAPGTASAFMSFPYFNATETLIIRRAGTQFELARLAGMSFSRTRVYTIVYKGNANVVTTGTKGRSLIQYTNL